VDFASLLPGATDRAAFYGQTGSGKTTLAHHLLEHRPWAVAFDTKGRLDWGARWKLHTRFETLVRDRSTHLIYRPDYGVIRDGDAVEKFWAWVYLRGNTTVYADEVTDFCHGPQVFPFHFGRCITRGRELGIATWSGSQRPAGIPKICLTESETIFAFFLKSEVDRDRVAAETGIDSDAMFGLPKHYFFVAHQSEKGAAGPFTLRLPGTTTGSTARDRARRLSRQSTSSRMSLAL
jgi:hypothetical protein